MRVKTQSPSTISGFPSLSVILPSQHISSPKDSPPMSRMGSTKLQRIVVREESVRRILEVGRAGGYGCGLVVAGGSPTSNLASSQPWLMNGRMSVISHVG